MNVIFHTLRDFEIGFDVQYLITSRGHVYTPNILLEETSDKFSVIDRNRDILQILL